MLDTTLHGLTFLDSVDSQAIADPFAALTVDSTKPRSILLRTAPLNTSQVPVAIDLSSDGYVSRSTDTPHQQFAQGLIDPYNFSVSIPVPDLCGSTQLGIGNISIANGDGSQDANARLDWLGIEQNLYLGPPEPAALTEFTKISKGLSQGLSWDLSKINVLNRDVRFGIQRPLHVNRYKGLGACVRYNGSTSYATGTVTCPAGSMAIGFYIRRQTSVGSLANIITWSDGVNAAGARSIQIGATANKVRFNAGNDAGTVFTVSHNTTIPLDTLVAGWAVLDLTSNVVRLSLRIGGVWIAATPVAITGTFNIVETSFTIGRFPTGIFYYPGEVDEVAIFDTIPSVTVQDSFAERQLAGTETGLIHIWHCDEGSGTSLGDSIPVGGVTLTLTSGTWVGTLEGDSSIVGTVKSVGLGVCKQVTPKWVDTQRLVLQWHDGSMQGLTACRDSADPLTFGSDLSDIYSATPTAGTFNTCLAKGLSRLGSTPVGEITGDIQGANGGTLGYADTVSEIDRKLMVDYGGMSDSLEIDDFAYDQLQLTNAAVVGQYFDEPINIDAASDRVLRDIRAWGGPTRVGIKTVGRIDDPANQVATVEWTINSIEGQSGGYSRVPFGVRYKEIIIGYRPYHTTLTPDQIAGAVSLANRNDFGKEYRYVSKKISGASEDADVLTVLTSMDSEADARLEMERLATFLSRDLEVVNLSLTSGLLTHFVGTIISLTIEQTQIDGTVVIRYETDSKHYVVLIVSEVISAGQPDRFNVMMLG